MDLLWAEAEPAFSLGPTLRTLPGGGEGFGTRLLKPHCLQATCSLLLRRCRFLFLSQYSFADKQSSNSGRKCHARVWSRNDLTYGLHLNTPSTSTLTVGEKSSAMSIGCCGSSDIWIVLVGQPVGYLLSTRSWKIIEARKERASEIINAQLRCAKKGQRSAQPTREMVYLVLIQVFIVLASPLCWNNVVLLLSTGLERCFDRGYVAAALILVSLVSLVRPR